MSRYGLPVWVSWPSDWRNLPLWSMFDRIKDVGHPDEEMLSVYREYGVIKKSSRDDNTNQTAENRNIYQLVDDGWLIVNRMKAWQGSVGIAPFRGIVSGHYICFRPRHGENGRFLNWLLRSNVYALEYERMSRGVRPGQIEIDNDELHGLRIALPPPDEQRRIADFLDAKTARTDSIITQKQRILTLLTERIQSIVNQATPGTVIRSADGRPIGIAGMDCVRLGALATVHGGFSIDPGRDNGTDAVTMPYLRVANVKDGSLALDDVKEMTLPRSLAARCTLLPDDVLMTEGGDPDKLGRGTVWPGDYGPYLHQNAIFAVRPNGRLLPAYLALVTRTKYARVYFETTASQTTGIAHTSSTRITGFRVPLPPIDEQRRMVDHTNAELANIDELYGAVEQQVRLLAERRQALITAAVTGAITV
jgi:type I restriction enzyme S subunit